MPFWTACHRAGVQMGSVFHAGIPKKGWTRYGLVSGLVFCVIIHWPLCLFPCDVQKWIAHGQWMSMVDERLRWLNGNKASTAQMQSQSAIHVMYRQFSGSSLLLFLQGFTTRLG